LKNVRLSFLLLVSLVCFSSCEPAFARIEKLEARNCAIYSVVQDVLSSFQQVSTMPVSKIKTQLIELNLTWGNETEELEQAMKLYKQLKEETNQLRACGKTYVFVLVEEPSLVYYSGAEQFEFTVCFWLVELGQRV